MERDGERRRGWEQRNVGYYESQREVSKGRLALKEGRKEGRKEGMRGEQKTTERQIVP